MPYVITTTTRELPNAEADEPVQVVTRHAAATLEEARNHATNIVCAHVEYDEEDRPTDRYVSEAMTFEESGGTVGPLPDGTVIEVRWATWRELAGTNRADLLVADNAEGEIIDAYNAQHR